MFGVDFTELLVILVVALIVIGPERLPKVARALGLLWGRAQRYVNGVKADLERDMAAAELRELREKVQKEADQAQQALRQTSTALDQQARELHDAVIKAQETPAAPATPVEQKKFPID